MATLLALLLVLTACTTTGSLTGGSSGTTEYEELESVQDLATYLESEGHTVTGGGAFAQSYFPGATAAELIIDGSTVRVFAFNDEEQAEDAAESISDTGTAIGTTQIDWISVPHFYQQDRLIALYVGTDEDMLDTMEDAMGLEIAGGARTGTGMDVMQGTGAMLPQE